LKLSDRIDVLFSLQKAGIRDPVILGETANLIMADAITNLDAVT